MFDHRNAELTNAQLRAKTLAIAECKRTGKMANSYCPNGEGDAYAYPGAEGKIHWGVNGSDGINIARDIIPG